MRKNKNYIAINVDDLKTLNANEALLLSIIRCYNINKQYCKLTINTLSRMLHCSERTIDNGLKTLKEKNLILSTKVGVNSVYFTITRISANSVRLYTDYFKNAELSARDMVILAMLENGYRKNEVEKILSKTTVYRAVKKLKELKLFKELAEVDEEYLSYFDDVKRTKINNKNRFNNFTQRNYNKKYFEEYGKIFFN